MPTESGCSINKIPGLSNINAEQLGMPTLEQLVPAGELDHPPRILMLYGSLRERSFSRFLTHETARTLAVMQVCGGSQSFNVVNALRLLGHWMRMFTIPNQSSVPTAYNEFDEEGRMPPSGYYDRVVDVMEELFKMTLLVRGRSDYLTDRYSERNERALKAIDRHIEKI